jgi:hypothetical protein
MKTKKGQLPKIAHLPTKNEATARAAGAEDVVAVEARAKGIEAKVIEAVKGAAVGQDINSARANHTAMRGGVKLNLGQRVNSTRLPLAVNNPTMVRILRRHQQVEARNAAKAIASRNGAAVGADVVAGAIAPGSRLEGMEIETALARRRPMNMTSMNWIRMQRCMMKLISRRSTLLKSILRRPI